MEAAVRTMHECVRRLLHGPKWAVSSSCTGCKARRCLQSEHEATAALPKWKALSSLWKTILLMLYVKVCDHGLVSHFKDGASAQC